MQRRLLPLGLLALATALAPFAAAGSPSGEELQAARSGLARSETDVVAAENALSAARGDVENLAAQARYFPIEQRILDADLFFETGDFEKASILYRDLADNPEFRARPGWDRVVFQLGESLFRQRGLARARQYFLEMAGPAGGRYRPLAMARLYEIAARTGEFASVEGLESPIEAPDAAPELLYAYGKYLDARGQKPRAAQAFLAVRQGTAPFARAQYFLGVLAVGRNALDEAFGRFALAAAQPADQDADREVQATSVLAKGRVLCAQGRVPECMQALQEVDRRSAAFPEALFELAWAHHKAGDLAGAARTLDILLMTSPSGELALKANALRGRILTRLDDPDGAEQSYQDVSETLGPVAAELDRLVREPGAMRDCFDFVLASGTTRRSGAPPVTDRTMSWLRTDDAMASLMEMFDDLGRQRDDVREALEIAESLLWALRSGGQLEAFPALKERFLRLKQAEGLSLRGGLAAVRSVRPVMGQALPGELKDRYRQAIGATEAAMAGIGGVPVSLEEYRQREKTMGAEFQKVGADLFLVESLLAIQRQQVVAIEQWLQEQRFSREGSSIGPEREAEIRAELSRFEGLLGRFDAEIAALKERLSRETLTLNTPETLRAEDRLRTAVARAVQAEAQVLRDAAGSLDAANRELATSAASLAGRGVAGWSGIGPVIARLMEVAGRGAREFEATVLREKARLADVAIEFQKAELDARSLSDGEGARILRAVQKRLGDVLLEADLGLVDMAWQREERVSDQLKALGREYGGQMKAVEEIERMLREEEAKGEAAAAAPQASPPAAP